MPTVSEVQIASLVPHPRNYRKHPTVQLARIGASLAQHGQYRNVVVQAGTNHIIAGHGVVEAARLQGRETILAMVLEVSDEEALQILVDDNTLERLAEDDGDALLQLLADLRDTEFQPASFDDSQINDLLRGLESSGIVISRTPEALAAEWVGLTEIDRGPQEAAVCLQVWFDDDEKRQEFIAKNELRPAKGGSDSKTISAWWPWREIEHGGAIIWEEREDEE